MAELSLEEIAEIKKRCEYGNHGWFENGSAMYECPICQKRFTIMDLSAWVFKRRTRPKGKNFQMLYLCSYPCTRKHDKALGIDK